MDTEEEYSIVKAIVQSQHSEEWDFLRNSKGDWPEDKKAWKNYRNYSMEELKEEMKLYKQSAVLAQAAGSSVYLLQGAIKFAKLRAGCRFILHQLAESCHGKVREGISDDGISYIGRSPHLSFQLVFEDKRDAEEFETQVSRVPINYRKRKLNPDSEFTTNLQVELQPIIKISADAKLVRVKEEDYSKFEGDAAGSPEYDKFSTSITSAVDINPETRLRLIEREDSITLFRQKPEKCHLISQTKFKEDKNNPNNIVFMSRNLHQQFDAINSSEGIPMFYLEYVNHNPMPINGILNGRPHPVYETTVNAVFKDEEAMQTLSAFFKLHTVLSDNRTIQFVLYFPSPAELEGSSELGFREYAKLNAEIIISRWRSYDGPLET